MTRILSECLLSPYSLKLARIDVSKCVINDTETESSSNNNKTDDLIKLVGWQPKWRADQILLKKFLRRPETTTLLVPDDARSRTQIVEEESKVEEEESKM